MQTSCKDTNTDFFEDKPSCKKAQTLQCFRVNTLFMHLLKAAFTVKNVFRLAEWQDAAICIQQSLLCTMRFVCLDILELSGL